jgi:hypothetical protein
MVMYENFEPKLLGFNNINVNWSFCPLHPFESTYCLK